MLRRHTITTSITARANELGEDGICPYDSHTWVSAFLAVIAPVIFIGVTRTKQISSLHESIYAIGQRYAVNPVPILHRQPGFLTSHWRISPFRPKFGPLIAWLDQYEFVWEFPINTLSIIRSMSSQPTTNFTVEFG